MPTPYRSVIKAVMELYRSIPATAFPDDDRPEIYLDTAVESDGSTEVRLPYVIIRDGGQTPDWSPAVSDARFDGQFTLEFWYSGDDAMENAAACQYATLWAGVDPLLKAGLALADLGPWLLSPTIGAPVSIWPGQYVQRYAGKLNNELVYSMSQQFRTQTYQQVTYPPI
jgi:hypothetical protein